MLVPLAILLVYSFFETKSFVTIYEFTFNTWVSLFDSGRWEVALRTLRIALTITIIELLIAFPFALWLAKGCRYKVTKAVVLALLTIPFFLDISSRTIVWRAILGQHGLVNVALLESGIISAPLEWLLYSEFSVHFGMIAPHFPTMVLPIYLAITIIDDDLFKGKQRSWSQSTSDVGSDSNSSILAWYLGWNNVHAWTSLDGLGRTRNARRRICEFAQSLD